MYVRCACMYDCVFVCVHACLPAFVSVLCVCVRSCVYVVWRPCDRPICRAHGRAEHLKRFSSLDSLTPARH